MQCKSSAQPDLLLFMETEHSRKAIAVPPRGLGYHSTNFGDVNSKRALWGKYLSGKAVSSAFPESIFNTIELYCIELNWLDLLLLLARIAFAFPLDRKNSCAII